MSKLAEIDTQLDRKLTRNAEEARLTQAQQRLLQLRLVLGGLLGEGKLGPPVLVLFEGWDASGKGGCIKRLVSHLDPRHVRVVQFGPPSPDELRHHWLTRFWLPLPGWGGMAVYDRSYYGRVLVERVEGLATPDQWHRAYYEIVEFERMLVDEGALVAKFFLHISHDEQLKRFERRQRDPLKKWKLTPEDWRNREKRPEYEEAVNDMITHTDWPGAPWHVIPAESKRYARVQIVESMNDLVETALRRHGIEPPPPV
ncbi:MAG: UDP-galactose-lipid carrier transferase [Acidimicrobiia bacterium]|nr:UDP-galactose-lipid carrier transferase [Acidimicrobiia bacterium]